MVSILTCNDPSFVITIQVTLRQLILAGLCEGVPRLVRNEIREFLGRESSERQQEAEDPRGVAAVPGAGDKA